ncbi:MAG: phosphate ABC transporter substrate-binding protein PstS family protein [Chloroflexi bacterium]|nr:phosphate ABC transporter substrate-binding protein PstS family protein [Chloroflexota bacterium]
MSATHAQTKLPPVKPAEVKGNIVIAGSSTVYPLAMKLAEDFKKDGYADSITIDSIGSGAGITRFCRGEIDIATASRAMNEKEIAACKAIGREPIQFQIGIDALTIAMSRQNKFVNSLNRKQLGLIFSGKAKTWKDVNIKWPAEVIKLFSPGTDSGTFDYFTSEIFKEETDSKRRLAIIPAVPGIQLSEDDNVLVKGVEGSANAIGYFGYAYYNEQKTLLKSIGYEGVLPSDRTVANGSYKFARPLFMISTAKIIKEKPQVAAYLNYALTNVEKVIKGVGYFPEPAAALEKTRNAFVTATN